MPPRTNAVYQSPRTGGRSTSSYEDTPEASATSTTARGKRKASDDVDDEEIDEYGDIGDGTTRKIPDTITPGNRETALGFIDFDKQRYFCAAYLGFTNAADLRLFVLSHYFLQYYLHYREEGAPRVRKDTVFRIIRDHFLKPGSDKSRFPLKLRDGGNAITQLRKKKKTPRTERMGREAFRKQQIEETKEYVAHLLILMVEDLDAQPDSVVDPVLQKQIWPDLVANMPHMERVPNVSNKTVQFPKLKTRYIESDLEPYNRAYNLLRYANSCLTPSSWHQRGKLTPRALNVVLPNDIPAWMREDAPTMDMEDQEVDDQYHQEQIEEQAEEQVEEQVDEQVGEQVEEQVGEQVEEQVGEQIEEQVEEDMQGTNSTCRREASRLPKSEDADNPTGLFTNPEPQARKTVIKQEPVDDIIDLTESPEPEDDPVKQEPVDDVYQSATSSNMREQDGDAATAEEPYRRPAPSRRRRMQREEVDEDKDEQDLQSQLKETKLQLKIVQLERRLAAQKKAKKG